MFKKAHGIEVLLRKASVDPEFRDRLLRHRGASAGEIGLDLSPAEAGILATVPEADLLRMIDKIEVPEAHRTAFRGKTAATMLAIVVGAGVLTGCPVACGGIRPKEEAGEDMPQATEPEEEPEDMPVRGIRPDPVEPKQEPGDGK